MVNFVRLILVAFGVLPLLLTTGYAAPRSFTINNRTPAAITSIAALDKSNGDATINFVLPSTVAPSAKATATADLPAGQCLFDLTYNLANGTKIVQTTVDLCNIDGMIVE